MDDDSSSGWSFWTFILICIVLWLAFFKVQKYEGQSAEEWFNDYDYAEAQVEELQSSYDSLQYEYEDLQSEHDDLKTKNILLENCIEDLADSESSYDLQQASYDCP